MDCIHSDIDRTHDIVINSRDGHGNTRLICASPKHGGVVCFFDSMTDLRAWETDVIEIRALSRGETSWKENRLKAINEGSYTFNP